MIGSVSTKYAFRSLLRHPMRSALSMVGVGIGCSIALIATSWMSGAAEMQIRAVSESGAGHLRVMPNMNGLKSMKTRPALPIGNKLLQK